MKISELEIYEELTGKIVRTVTFGNTLNYIVDESLREESGNKIGKTTILKLIDICFGASGKNGIYYDADTKITDKKIEEYITKKKVRAKLSLSTSDILDVGLYSRSKNYINEVYTTQQQYNAELKKIMFNSNQLNCSFRETIKKFVRVSAQPTGREKNAIMMLNGYTKDKTYEKLYLYLLGIDSNALEEIETYQEVISKLEADKKNYLKHENISEDSLIVKLNSLEEIKQKSELEVKVYRENIASTKTQEDKVVKRNKYIELSNEQEYIKFINNKLEKNIESLKSDIFPKAELEAFFEEIKLDFDLKKDFFEVANFNKELANNKSKKYRQTYEANLVRLKDIKTEIDELSVDETIFDALIDENIIDTYSTLVKEETLISEEYERFSSISHNIANFNKEIKKETEKLSNVESGENQDEKLIEFNTILNDVSSKILDEKASLLFEDDKFIPKIDKETGESNGTKNPFIIALDISFIIFARKNNIKVPEFIVIDELESTHYKDIADFNKVIADNNIQLITSILKHNLDHDPDMKEEYIALKLSKNNKAFRQ